MEKLKKALDQMATETQKHFDTLRADLRGHREEMRASLAQQQAAIEELQGAGAQQQGAMADMQAAIADLQSATSRLQAGAANATQSLAHLHSAATVTGQTLLRHEHTLDQSMARVADDLNRHRENVGTAIYGYVEDVNALKIEVRGLAARVDALERDTPPAA
ncbi:MAG: hypothetical protein EB084_24760 [Proteobacteria bacterium]|nr:hypothetical protein [Pseudomonadota bacterium]